uniref:Uncharacterized protein n=1 Tax=Chrysemys picta bellii TaxID=8478 RepID=A0A8C3FES5_CHRPI
MGAQEGPHSPTDSRSPHLSQTQQSKPAPFSPAPTGPSPKVRAVSSTGPPAQQPHLPQAQLMLAGSQLAGVSGGPRW